MIRIWPPWHRYGPDGVPAGDTRHAHPARVYNYWLGGKDNFAADREAAEQAIAANPGIKTDVRANRAFLARVVRYLADERMSGPAATMRGQETVARGLGCWRGCGRGRAVVGCRLEAISFPGGRQMKVSLFEQVPYRYIPEGFENQHNSVVTAPYQVVEPGRMQESLFSAYAELMHGARAGFDGVCVTEHSQSSYDISPNPTLLASAVACAAQAEGLDVAITVLGRSLGKTREPLKIAEEYALLDCISGGRLIAGFPVGLSYDANLNAALPAIETRERYREHRDLILKAWSEPRPFPWNGRFEKYGQVNIWPRPIQQPHPPIWIPGTGSAGTLRDILKNDYAFVYLSWDGPKLTGRQIFDRYWELAEELGRDRNPYRLAFLQVVAVSETDERAEKEYATHLQAHYRSGLGAIPHTAMAVPGYAEPAAIEGMLRSTGPAGMLSRMKTATYSEIVDSQVAIVGSPATVADQIEAFVREFRIGNLLVMLQSGSMPRDLTEKNISLFAEEVLPRLRTIWDAEGWANPWWPRAQGTTGAVTEAAAGGKA